MAKKKAAKKKPQFIKKSKKATYPGMFDWRKAALQKDEEIKSLQKELLLTEQKMANLTRHSLETCLRDTVLTFNKLGIGVVLKTSVQSNLTIFELTLGD